MALAVVLYLAVFFLLLHLIDRLATRTPVEDDDPAPGGPAPLG